MASFAETINLISATVRSFFSSIFLTGAFFAGAFLAGAFFATTFFVALFLTTAFLLFAVFALFLSALREATRVLCFDFTD